jgi:hypothetical protein
MVSTGDIATFFLGTGVALTITLLAWGEQIRRPSKEIREIEDKFIHKYKVEKQALHTITQSDKKKQSNFSQFMSSLVSTIKKVPAGKIELVNKLEKLQKIASDLETVLSYRYYFTIILSIALMVFGASILLVDKIIFPAFQDAIIHTISVWMVIIFFTITFLGFVAILISLVYSRHIENEFKGISIEMEDEVET